MYCTTSERGNTNSPELLLLIFLPLTNHHNHFLAATLDLYFHPGSVGGCTLFVQLDCFFVFFLKISLLFVILYLPVKPVFDISFNLPFFFTIGMRIMREKIFNDLFSYMYI